MLRAAVEQFIDKDYKDIEAIATETLEGHQRAMMGNMTVDQIFKDRKKFSSQVFEIASSDLFNMGIQVISYTLKDIKDEDSYMVSLGMARTAEIVRDARIGEAEANRDAQIEVAISEEQRLASKLINKAEVERAKRDYEVKKAAYDTEVETARAEAELAYKLQEAKVRQRIKEEMMTTEIIERMKLIGKFCVHFILSFWMFPIDGQTSQPRRLKLCMSNNLESIYFTEVSEQEVSRKEKELDAKVMKPAEAEKHRCVVMAEATKSKTLSEAEGAAEAVAMKGDAEAEAIEAKAKAASEVMAMKADAWKEYKKAAKVSMWMDSLPSMAAEVAAPLSQTNKITMVGFTNEDSSLGPSLVTNEVLNIMEKIPNAVTSMTGYSVKSHL